MAFTYRSKIKKIKGEPSEFEETVAQYIFDLATNSDLKADLTDLHITAAKEVDFGKGKKAVAIFVPFVQLRAYRRIHSTLVDELEKKLGKQIVIIAQRKILPKPSKKNTRKQQQRPRSRTLSTVHDAILEDLVYPGEIIDRRTRVRADGVKSGRVTLDSKHENLLETKLEAFAGIYRKLTGKDITFLFPNVPKVEQQ